MTKKEQFIETVLSLEDIPQSPKWHPEGNTLEHVKFIIYGLNFKESYGFISDTEYQFLTWVALFHDLGKIDTLTFDDNGNPHAYGHEYKAENYIKKFEEIIPTNINIGHLHELCRKHMKAHLMVGDKMREFKKIRFRDEFSNERLFYLMMVFESCDSAHTLYDFLRRDEKFVDRCYLSAIDFYNEIRNDMEEFYNYDFEQWLKNKIK